jgi:hypothetical protein
MLSFKDYLERLAARPALAPRRERVERRSCERCDGEVFLISSRGDATCAGCGLPLEPGQRLRSS